MFRLRAATALLLVFALNLKSETDASEVTIEQGTLRGKAYRSRNGTEYYGYWGIPFAKPPIGELRFEPPQPPDPWQGVRNALEPSPICIQKEIFTIDAHEREIEGQEDCLYLNVFAPAAKTHSLPVMVYIHGGAFIVGSTNMYDLSYFLDHEIIIVTIQYRLHVLGFLSTGDDVLPGNNGMKDQVAALKWVQKNIAAFGGDPTRVTIFGESAGSGSVHYHLYSPLTKGLFHRAICQSGTALAPWAYTPRDLARQRARALGIVTSCPTSSSKSLVECLKELPAEELVLAHNKFYAWDFDPVIPFSVVDEPKTQAGAFITEDPWSENPVNRVPLIMGISSAEGGVKATRYLHGDGTKAAYLNQHYKRLFPVIFFYNTRIEDKSRISEITEKIKTFYFGDKNISAETAHQLVRLFTDGYFAYDSIEAARRYKVGSSVYFYQYDHRNQRTFNEIFGSFPDDLGVCHADDLISFFPITGLFPAVTEGDDFRVSQRLVKYWVNFAYNGIPDESWTPLVSDDFEYLHITTKSDQMKTRLIEERYQFWNSLKLIPTFEGESNSPTFTDEL